MNVYYYMYIRNFLFFITPGVLDEPERIAKRELIEENRRKKKRLECGAALVPSMQDPEGSLHSMEHQLFQSDFTLISTLTSHFQTTVEMFKW